jgi:hypothetical protein
VAIIQPRPDLGFLGGGIDGEGSGGGGGLGFGGALGVGKSLSITGRSYCIRLKTGKSNVLRKSADDNRSRSALPEEVEVFALRNSAHESADGIDWPKHGCDEPIAQLNAALVFAARKPLPLH